MDAVWILQLLWVRVCVCKLELELKLKLEFRLSFLFVCGELWPAICAHNFAACLMRRIKMKKENNRQSAGGWEVVERCEGTRRNGQWAIEAKNKKRTKENADCRLLPGCGYWFSLRQQAAHHDEHDDDDATTDDDDAALAIFCGTKRRRVVGG